MADDFASIKVVEIVRNDGGGFLKQVYDEHAFDIATGWHQYRNDPAVSTTVWYRSGQPKGAPWTNQWGWEDKNVDKTIDDAATEVDPAKRKALYAQFVKEVNTELPVWMPIEQIFVTVIAAKARNHSNHRAGDRRAGTIFGFPPDAISG